MITAYYSTVLDQPIDRVWSMIRDFNNYPAYIDGVTASIIEDNKSGDEVGAVRRFRYGETWIRQRLGAHSDAERSLTYVGLDPFGLPSEMLSPVRYQGTIHLIEIVEGARTFIEWSVKAGATPEEAERWRNLLVSLIAEWTASLRRALDRLAAAPSAGGGAS